MHRAVFQVLRPVHARAAARLGREYVLAFEDTTLKVLRSGPYRVATLHTERFDTPDALLANVRAKIQRRVYNGYVLIWFSDDFPLLDWMRERGDPIEKLAYTPPGIQLDLPWEA